MLTFAFAHRLRNAPAKHGSIRPADDHPLILCRVFLRVCIRGCIGDESSRLSTLQLMQVIDTIKIYACETVRATSRR